MSSSVNLPEQTPLPHEQYRNIFYSTYLTTTKFISSAKTYTWVGSLAARRFRFTESLRKVQQESHLLPAANEVWSKVTFLHVSVFCPQGDGVYPSMQYGRRKSGVYPIMQWGRWGLGWCVSLNAIRQAVCMDPTGMHP